jgi:hypothetical protein
VGTKTKSGGKAPQEALVEHGGALTPAEATHATVRDGKGYLPKGILPKPEGCLGINKKAATFEGRIAAFASRVLAGQYVSPELANLLKAAQRAEVPAALLPEMATPLGKWLRQMSFAIQFKAAWLKLVADEKQPWLAYYAWYLENKCPRNLEPALAEWLASLQPQQASQAA